MAACAKSRHLRVNGKDALWNYDTSGGINSIVADDEERVVSFSGIKRWLKELFKNWSQRNKKIPEGTEYDFSPETINKMLKSRHVRREMFKRWDGHTMEDIKLKIGRAQMNNKGCS